MWKLNKSIAKEMLPTQPVDFTIEPWWGVCLVNFTIEEFKVSSHCIIYLNLNSLCLKLYNYKLICKEKINIGALLFVSCVEINRRRDGNNRQDMQRRSQFLCAF